MTKSLLFTSALLMICSLVAAQPKVIAHRGYWTPPGSAQNSLTAQSKAHEIGAYGAEFDVWLTADKQLIVNHDKVHKGTGIDMEQATAKQITGITLSNGEPIPTLDAYLRLATQKPGMQLILEMKPLSNPEREVLAAKKIVKALKKHKLTKRTDIIAFSLNACLAFKDLLPENKIYYLGSDRTPQQIKDNGFAGIDYHLGALRRHPEWIDEAHALGLEVNVWTVNSEQDMREFIDKGVDYITTDYPERLQALLKK